MSICFGSILPPPGRFHLIFLWVRNLAIKVWPWTTVISRSNERWQNFQFATEEFKCWPLIWITSTRWKWIFQWVSSGSILIHNQINGWQNLIQLSIKGFHVLNVIYYSHYKQEICTQEEISKLPILYLLGRTVTFLNYLISSMYNCFISKIRKPPECQSNYISCYAVVFSAVGVYPTACSFISPLCQPV